MHRDESAIDGVRQSLRQHWSRLEARYQIVFACFLATFTAYVERVGFPLAFTALAKDADIGEGKKGTVMSAFFWGYALSQVRTILKFDGGGRLCPQKGQMCLLCTGQTQELASTIVLSMKP